MFYKRPAILILLLLCACQPVEVETTTARQTIRAAFTPTLSWIGPVMNTCSQLYSLDVIIDEIPTNQLANAAADLVFSWGAVPLGNGVAYELGTQRLAVIIHPQNSLGQISLAQLRGIYNQSIQSWGELDGLQGNSNPIERWSFPDLQDTRQIIESTLIIRDTGFSPLWLSPDPHAMRQAVASNPLAIGYLPGNWLDGSVKELTIFDHHQEIINFEKPIFMVQASSSNISQDWLTCITQGIITSQ
jgi:hypothetical protein